MWVKFDASNERVRERERELTDSGAVVFVRLRLLQGNWKRPPKLDPTPEELRKGKGRANGEGGGSVSTFRPFVDRLPPSFLAHPPNQADVSLLSSLSCFPISLRFPPHSTPPSHLTTPTPSLPELPRSTTPTTRTTSIQPLEDQVLSLSRSRSRLALREEDRRRRRGG